MKLKRIFTVYLIVGAFLAACSSSAGDAPPAELAAPAEPAIIKADQTSEETAPATQPDFSDLFAEANQLYDQLEANTPIEVAPANASAQTVVLTVPTLF